MKKALEIYKTIKYKDETFSHPTVSVFFARLQSSRKISTLTQTHFKTAFFPPKLTGAEEATMLLGRH